MGSHTIGQEKTMSLIAMRTAHSDDPQTGRTECLLVHLDAAVDRPLRSRAEKLKRHVCLPVFVRTFLGMARNAVCTIADSPKNTARILPSTCRKT
jgi:hypothetical protein